jgi:ATP/maltotriose-dependent transcriptional regulator MalT
VLEHAARAARQAARFGAHRESAELYRLALRSGDPADHERSELLAALSYECYLTDQLGEALAVRLDAMHLAELVGDRLAVGVAQRWVSRLSWFQGRNDDSRLWAHRAIETLSPLGESPELAMAYSNLAQLHMLANESAAAIELGEHAIELARRLGDREVEMHALNNVGTARMISGDLALGEQQLAQSLELALRDDAQEHAARAYTNLSATPVVDRRYDEAERVLRAGLAYCADRDLDSWRLYMGSWLARVHLERGQFAKAASVAADILRHRHVSPVTTIVASLVATQIDLRAGRPDDGRLDAALDLAVSTGESQRLVPVVLARAEAAWLADRIEDIEPEVDRVWAIAVDQRHDWSLGELAWWLHVAGAQPRDLPIPAAAPFAAMLADDWSTAAQTWAAIGCPLWHAIALAGSPALDDARTALEMLDEWDVPAVRNALLRDRQAAGLPVPRGPRASSRTNSWGLTAREVEILGLLTDGLSNAELARRLYLSEKTVGHHVSAILRKLGEPTRSRAVAAARKHGIVAQT